MTTHPTSRALVRFIDGEHDGTTRNHVEECAYCRSLVAEARDGIAQIPGEAAWDPVNIEVPTPTTGIPTRGDVWRVAWDDVHQLAVVLSESDAEVVVAPVLPEPRLADEWTVLLAASRSDVGLELAVAAVHRFTLPLFVFDACVGRLSPEGMETVAVAATDYQRGSTTNMPTGTPVLNVLDERVEAIDALAEEFVDLSEASWYTVPADTEATGKFDWAELMEADVIEPGRAYELVQGAPPTPDEVVAATAAGQQVGRLPYPRDLVVFLDRPENSSQLRLLASETTTTEAQIRIDAADRLTERRVALAARGGDGSFDWEPLFREYLDEARS